VSGRQKPRKLYDCRRNHRTSTRLLVGRLVFRNTSCSSVFAVAGFAGNAFRFAFVGNFLIELIDDVLELVGPTQRVFLFGFRHIASIEFRALSDGSRRRQAIFIPCRAPW
jgi:hypothetical protein